MRTFVAIALDDALRAALVDAVARAKRALGRGAQDWSFTRPESTHLTLTFLGEIEEARVPGIEQALQRATAGVAAFDAAVAGFGAFPNPGHPRVMWLGFGEGAEALTALEGRVRHELTGLGFELEARPYTPHLTLARARRQGRPRSVAELVASEAGAAIGTLPVKELVLYRSQLAPGGSIYTPLAKVPLA